MVTLLIQDMRSGTIDRQLAEVRVPLKHGDVPEDGFWADAKDIVCLSTVHLVYQLTFSKCRPTSFKVGHAGSTVGAIASVASFYLIFLFLSGPARAYTLRGKYRQFILRVSANNVDDFMSANVAVQPDRTLDVVVEMVGITPIFTQVLLTFS